MTRSPTCRFLLLCKVARACTYNEAERTSINQIQRHLAWLVLLAVPSLLQLVVEEAGITSAGFRKQFSVKFECDKFRLQARVFQQVQTCSTRHPIEFPIGQQAQLTRNSLCWKIGRSHSSKFADDTRGYQLSWYSIEFLRYPLHGCMNFFKWFVQTQLWHEAMNKD